MQKIRNTFIEKLNNNDVCENGTIEILNASFIANEESIFGSLNLEYACHEVEWYRSQSLNVQDITGGAPTIWKEIADKDGFINSNYGWCIYSEENHYQFHNCLYALINDKHTRQAAMLYIPTDMHERSIDNGKSDFMCTFSVQLFIRSNILSYHVYMRSNDAVYGYKNDKFWHDFVFDQIYNHLIKYYPRLIMGDMYWNVASLHIYNRHFNLIKE
jgi:thymidylate synthase